ncbi:MAG: hypothetical protein LQ345_004655 [Seirophora villosa]|nr:MAG: hypothetical protein LQ345_004655 [Seirophora villosa]
MDHTNGYYWPGTTSAASSAAFNMQGDGDGTPSESDLERHYSIHPQPILQPVTPSTSSQAPQGDLPWPFPEPADANELSINRAVAERKSNLTVDVELPSSLIRKLAQECQVWITLTRCAGAAVKFVFIGVNVQINYNALPYIGAKDPSPFAWIYSVLGIEHPCRYSCCIAKAIEHYAYYAKFNCGMPICTSTNICSTLESHDLKNHWRGHCFVSGLYRCDAPDCTHACKRFADLERHMSTSHCLDPQKFPCSFPGCERGGENGFPRKDKLKSHFESVHRGVGIPPKQPRALAPKV